MIRYTLVLDPAELTALKDGTDTVAATADDGTTILLYPGGALLDDADFPIPVDARSADLIEAGALNVHRGPRCVVVTLADTPA